ncbi:hypothetical protein OBBRIDRAFT_801376 [Obba rivulosa]|uniref:Uncharacterized protein n=1 Tax=Obba rivulosa TaxID=1052685 RepID=A0A8E2DQZ7_9APHY|nr:hypothetical protein OBBRIDRAFT_801376 [Obba rivulosa]
MHTTSTSQCSHTGTATSEPASTPAGQAGGACANASRTSTESDAANRNPSLMQCELDQAFGIERTVSQEQALANINTHLVTTRDALGVREGYLGNACLRNEVKWLQDNRMQRLVMSVAMWDAEEALAMYALNDNRAEHLPDPANSVELTAIVCINPENCFVQADSYWTSEASSRPLEKAKLRFQGTMPTRPHILQQDFEQVCRNLEWLMSEADNATESLEGLLGMDGRARTIQFWHAVFEQLTDENGYMDNELKMPTEFCMEGWLVSSMQARNTLRKIKDTHRTQALPAYDMHGVPIPPLAYTKMLCDIHLRAGPADGAVGACVTKKAHHVSS